MLHKSTASHYGKRFIQQQFTMEPKLKIDLLQKALNHLIEEQRGTQLLSLSSNHHQDPAPVHQGDGEDTQLLLSNLLSQMDSLKEDMVEQPQQPSKCEMSTPANELAGGSYEAISNEEIMKELRDVKKQNSRTHWLLSLLIALTLAWQLSEVSIVLKLKQGLTNPLKSIGHMLTSIFKNGHSLNEQELERDAANKTKQVPQIYSFPGLKAPEIPHAVFTNEDQ